MTRPLVLVIGDSWVDYPGSVDIPSLLEERGWEVCCTGHHGDTLEQLAYEPQRERKLARLFREVGALKAAGRAPHGAVMIVSAGGNDIAGDELRGLLAHARTGLDLLHEGAVANVFANLEAVYRSLLFGARALAVHYLGAPIPTFVHGYDYPTPDGRKFRGLVGPWLAPAFEAKGIESTETRRAIMKRLIDRFHDMLDSLAAERGLEHVRVVDLRGELAGEPALWWADELHPTPRGFAVVTNRFEQAIDQALQLQAQVP